MEEQFFEINGGWDVQDTMCFSFYKCVSKVHLGEFPVGTQFAAVYFDYQSEKLSVYVDGESEPVEFGLKLALG
jgi:hypothetical protein